MRTPLILLLFCWLISTVEGLNCYVCQSTTTNDNCNQNTAYCQAPLDTCMTTVDISGSFKAIVKQCSSANICSGAALSASLSSNGSGTTVICCTSNLCNYSGASTVCLHTLLLVLPLCIICALAYASG